MKLIVLISVLVVLTKQHVQVQLLHLNNSLSGYQRRSKLGQAVKEDTVLNLACLEEGSNLLSSQEKGSVTGSRTS